MKFVKKQTELHRSNHGKFTDDESEEVPFSYICLVEYFELPEINKRQQYKFNNTEHIVLR